MSPSPKGSQCYQFTFYIFISILCALQCVLIRISKLGYIYFYRTQEKLHEFCAYYEHFSLKYFNGPSQYTLSQQLCSLSLQLYTTLHMQPTPSSQRKALEGPLTLGSAGSATAPTGLCTSPQPASALNTQCEAPSLGKWQNAISFCLYSQ